MGRFFRVASDDDLALRPALRIVFAPTGSWRSKDAPHGWKGEAKSRTIRVDPREPYPAKTLLHEMLHVKHPDWSETRVARETSRRWARMTWRAVAELYRLLGRAE